MLDHVDCIFCSLLADGVARWVARGPVASAFAPLDPLGPGHTLVLPTEHYEDVFAVPQDVLTSTIELVRAVAHAMRSELGAGGVNILNASGQGSEQSVRHLHFHVVPRWTDDGFTTWPTERSKHRVATDPIEALARTLG